MRDCFLHAAKTALLIVKLQKNTEPSDVAAERVLTSVGFEGASTDTQSFNVGMISSKTCFSPLGVRVELASNARFSNCVSFKQISETGSIAGGRRIVFCKCGKFALLHTMPVSIVQEQKNFNRRAHFGLHQWNTVEDVNE